MPQIIDSLTYVWMEAYEPLSDPEMSYGGLEVRTEKGLKLQKVWLFMQ